MTRKVRDRLKVLAVAALAAGATGAGRAAIVNGGFESGLTNWQVPVGSVFAVGSAPSIVAPGGTAGPTWLPTEGNTFAYLLARGTGNDSTTLLQGFTAAQGDVLSLDVFFDAGDYDPPGNDVSFVHLKYWVPGGCNFTICIGPSQVTYPVWEQKVSDVGNYGASGWTHLTFTLPATLPGSGGLFDPGGYTLLIGIENIWDNLNASAVGVDNVGLNLPAPTAVPLPPALTLLLAGLGGLTLLARRRKAV
jgi:hypothetical protein